MNGYVPSDAARAASDHFNSLPSEERVRLAPLLEHYRQMGLAEAAFHLRSVTRKVDDRIRLIREDRP